MVIQKWHKGVTVRLMGWAELLQRYGITENGIRWVPLPQGS